MPADQIVAAVHTDTRPKAHVCFVALAAWPVLSKDRTIRAAGGAEVQQCHIARGLIARGYQVSMICMDYGQPDGVVVDGVRVYNAHRPLAGIPVVRFVHPRLTSIWQAMRRCGADVYYQRGAGMHTALVARYCRAYGRKFIFAAAHDTDFDPKLPYIRFARDRALFRWGLHKATSIVVQTPAQLELCRDFTAKRCKLIRSCYVPPRDKMPQTDGYILWVASLRQWKRPEWFIELARRLPAFRFRMIGGADDPDYERKLRQLAAPHANLEFHGFVPYAEVEEHFDGAQIFVSTSVHEGFPNTYLQAWARTIPTVGTVRTGTIWQGAPAEVYVQTLDALTDAVGRLARNEAIRREAGDRCLSCFKKYHSLDATLSSYAGLIESMFSPAGTHI